MKLIKVNPITSFILSIAIAFFAFLLPIIVIQALWNSTVAVNNHYLEINYWQSLILWFVVLTLIHISGIFKFEIAVESKNFDEELLKRKIEEIKKKSLEKELEEIKEEAKKK